MVDDPTPNASIDLVQLVHKVHFARLLEGNAEQGNWGAGAGKLTIVGYNNSLNDLSEALLPVDVRSCTTCHGDTNAACSASADCGVGQSCVNRKCVNTAWTQPSARACITCHDSADAAAHAALQTYAGGGSPVESCEVCHGTDAAFSVSSVHNITAPYVPPYQREP